MVTAIVNYLILTAIVPPLHTVSLYLLKYINYQDVDWQIYSSLPLKVILEEQAWA